MVVTRRRRHKAQSTTDQHMHRDQPQSETVVREFYRCHPKGQSAAVAPQTQPEMRDDAAADGALRRTKCIWGRAHTQKAWKWGLASC